MDTTPLPGTSITFSSCPSYEVNDGEDNFSSPKVCAICTNARHATLVFRATFIIESQKNVDSVIKKSRRKRSAVKECRRSDIVPDSWVVVLKPFRRLEFKNGLCEMRQMFDDSTLNYIRLNETEKNISEGYLLDTRCVDLTEDARTLMNDVKKRLHNTSADPNDSRAEEFEGLLHFLTNLASLSLQRGRESTLTTKPTLFLITNEVLIGLGFHRNNIRRTFNSIEQHPDACVVDINEMIHRKEYNGMTIFNPIERGSIGKTCIAVSIEYLPVALSRSQHHSARHLAFFVSAFFFVYIGRDWLANKHVQAEVDKKNKEIREYKKIISSMQEDISLMHYEMEATAKENGQSAVAESKELEEKLEEAILAKIELWQEINELKSELAASHEEIEEAKKEIEAVKKESQKFEEGLEESLEHSLCVIEQQIEISGRCMEKVLKDKESKIREVVSGKEAFIKDILKKNEKKIQQIVSDKEREISVIVKENEKNILKSVLKFFNDIRSRHLVAEDMVYEEYNQQTFSIDTERCIERLSNRIEVLAFFETATSSASGDETVYTYKLLSKSRKDGNYFKATVDLLKRYSNLTPVGLVIGCKNCKILEDYLVNNGILTKTGKGMNSSMRIDKVLSVISSIVEPHVRVLGRGNEVFFNRQKKFENGTLREDASKFDFYVTASSKKRRKSNTLVNHQKRSRSDVF